MSYTISTLLYCFNAADEVLLMKRRRKPNQGLWSPPGGKLEQVSGESPFACAVREAHEELNITFAEADLHLTGLVTEQSNDGHWLMFLFEILTRMDDLPRAHAEGHFEFFSKAGLNSLALPLSDKENLWPLFWKFRRGFFVAHVELQGETSRCKVVQAMPDYER